MSDDKIYIVRDLPNLSPTEPFGRVARAMDVTNIQYSDGNLYRTQIFELDPGKSFDLHIHVSEHIIYALDGSGKINIWDHEGEDPIKIFKDSKKTYPFSKGDLVVIPKNVVHAFEASEHEYLKELIINIPGISLHDERRIVWV